MINRSHKLNNDGLSMDRLITQREQEAVLVERLVDLK